MQKSKYKLSFLLHFFLLAWTENFFAPSWRLQIFQQILEVFTFYLRFSPLTQDFEYQLAKYSNRWWFFCVLGKFLHRVRIFDVSLSLSMLSGLGPPQLGLFKTGSKITHEALSSAFLKEAKLPSRILRRQVDRFQPHPIPPLKRAHYSRLRQGFKLNALLTRSSIPQSRTHSNIGLTQHPYDALGIHNPTLLQKHIIFESQYDNLRTQFIRIGEPYTWKSFDQSSSNRRVTTVIRLK